MHDSQQAVIPVNDHSLPDRHYDDDLFLAGIAADQASTEDVFAAYHADLAENTRAKQHVDLACFSEYLAEAHVTRDPDDLYKDAYAWDRISYGIVKGFVRYL